MSDSTGCYHFRMIFERMAREPEKYRELAHFIYGVCRERDFHPAEMELDDALIGWDLAKKGPNPDYGCWPGEPEACTLFLGADYGKYPVMHPSVVEDPEDTETDEFF